MYNHCRIFEMCDPNVTVDSTTASHINQTELHFGWNDTRALCSPAMDRFHSRLSPNADLCVGSFLIVIGKTWLICTICIMHKVLRQ